MKLKHIATIKAGYPFRGKILEQSSTNIIAVQMRDVSLTEGILWSNCVNTSLTGIREPRWLQPNDILFVARGNYNFAVLVDNSLINIGKQAVAAPHFFVIRLSDTNILPDFLVWLLNQQPCQRHFEQNAEGSLMKSIRRSVLEETPIIIPSIAKQQTIVGIANTLQQQQLIAKRLILNSKSMMNAIASNLLNNREE